MAEFTPGPWHVNSPAIISGEETLARVYWSEGRSHDENDANEKLIAAAPELLAALIACENMGYTRQWVAMRNAAIAKATGK